MFLWSNQFHVNVVIIKTSSLLFSHSLATLQIRAVLSPCNVTLSIEQNWCRKMVGVDIGDPCSAELQ